MGTRPGSFESGLYRYGRKPARTRPPIRTATPEQTFKTFMDAMNDYREGVETNDEWLQGRIDDAIYCLNLSNLEGKARHYRGETAARSRHQRVTAPPHRATPKWDGCIARGHAQTVLVRHGPETFAGHDADGKQTSFPPDDGDLSVGHGPTRHVEGWLAPGRRIVELLRQAQRR